MRKSQDQTQNSDSKPYTTACELLGWLLILNLLGAATVYFARAGPKMGLTGQVLATSNPHCDKKRHGLR